MLYRWKVRALKHPRVNYWWRYFRARRGAPVGHYSQLPQFVRRLSPGRSFVDVGCMWGVNGEHVFAAEEAGATQVTGVDVFGPTPEFERTRAERGSRARFVLGDATDPRVLNEIGPADIVLCAGVLYHHPSPFDLLVALRRLCGLALILRTATIPEIDGVPNAAVFYPMLAARDRRLWQLDGLGLRRQAGISDEFRPAEGYGNWFWGLTPSCVRSMLQVAGFRVEEQWEEAFAHTMICAPAVAAFEHRLPGPSDARRLAQKISAAGIATPA